MKRKLWLVVAAALLGWTPAAFGVTIGFVPNAQTVNLGDPASVDVVISDLGNAVVGAFDLTVSLSSSSMIAPTGVTFGLSLGDATLFETLEGTVLAPLSVNFASSSLLDALALDALQGSSFTLATLAFATKAPGTTFLSLNGIVVDAPNADLIQFDTQRGSITVEGTGVIPEPGTLVLMGSGLAGLAHWARRRRRAA